MKKIQQPIVGDDLLAVERFHDDTRHMIEFLVLEDCPLGHSGQHIRRFLSEDAYAEALAVQREGAVRIGRHFNIIEGHLLPDKPKKKRRK